MTLLWLDDVRDAPPGWTGAKTLDEAKAIVLAHLAEYDDVLPAASLDHDLGATPEMIEQFGIGARGEGIETGLDFVKWLISEGQVPKQVCIHSWSPVGAKAMLDAIVADPWDCEEVTIAPFLSPPHDKWLARFAS